MSLFSKRITGPIAAIGTTAALAMTALSATAQPTGQEVSLSYDMFGGGLYLASFDALARTDDDTYSVVVDGRTRGVLVLLGDWRARASASGSIDDGLQADWFQMNIYEEDEINFLRIDHLPNGRVETLRRPQRNLIADVPMTDRVGTMDPITSLIGAGLGLGTDLACPDDQAIFDGTRRYDITFETIGEEEIDGSYVDGFVGTAMRCKMRVEPVSGHWRDTESRSFWRYNHPDDDPDRLSLDVWFAPPLPNVPSTMVRAQREVDYLGMFLIHLVDASVAPISQIAEQ